MINNDPTPGLSLRSNPGLELANTFGVTPGLKLASTFGVINDVSMSS